MKFSRFKHNPFKYSSHFWYIISSRPLLLVTILFILFGIKTVVHGSDFLPKSFESKFEQNINSLIDKKSRKSSGVLRYLFPGHLKIEVLSPVSEKSTFLCNPTTTWFYVPPFEEGEKGEVTIQSTSHIELVAFFDSLKDGLISNKNFTITSTSPSIYKLIFSEPLAKKINIKSAILTFIKESASKKRSNSNARFVHLQKIELTHKNNQLITIELNEINDQKLILEKDFEFQIPPNTNTIKQ